jgi:hypothetical protein
MKPQHVTDEAASSMGNASIDLTVVVQGAASLSPAAAAHGPRAAWHLRWPGPRVVAEHHHAPGFCTAPVLFVAVAWGDWQVAVSSLCEK